MVSNASEDLPEPESPVTTVSVPRGISRLIFFRLCWRAPRTTIFVSAMLGAGLPAGRSPRAPEQAGAPHSGHNAAKVTFQPSRARSAGQESPRPSSAPQWLRAREYLPRFMDEHRAMIVRRCEIIARAVAFLPASKTSTL